MFAAAVRVELRIPNVRSLKEKRRVLKGLIAGLRKSFPIGVAEVDHQDLWQRSSIGLAVVAPQAGQLERMIHSIERHLRGEPEVEVLDMGISHMEDPS